MPPALYFYANFATIRLNKNFSTVKSFNRPWLRDIEWDFFYNYTEARGFSGFAKDEMYSCNTLLLNPDITDTYLRMYDPSVFNRKGERKKYVNPRSYMRQFFPESKGSPIFKNRLKNILLLGSRETGKSYMVGAGLVPHNFLFDGATEYNEETIRFPSPVEVLVGAETSDKSADILKKSRDCMTFLPGKQSIGSRQYPSPFAKRFKGS